MFVNPETIENKGAYEARMRLYQYSMTFGKQHAYCLIRIDELREVHAEYPTENAHYTDRIIDDEHKTVTPGIYHVDFSVMKATIITVFRNSEHTDFHEGDEITIGTKYTQERYGRWKYASQVTCGHL